MKKVDVYWLPHCSTCKKAVAYLEDTGIEIASFRDLKEKPLTRTEVVRLAGLTGGAENLFSRRAIKYRTMKLKERELSESDLLELMAEESTFIKRPVVVFGEKALAGYSAKKYGEHLGE
jgi:arsenate reductase (glutaredoxin)